MALPSTVTTNLWPDHKNVITGPFPRVAVDSQNTTNGLQVLGFSTNDEQVAQSFKPSASGLLVAVDLPTGVTGNPTDNLLLALCADDADKPGAELATATILSSVAKSSVERYKRTIFPSPFTVVAGTTYWLRLSRVGSVSTSNFYAWPISTSNPYADGKLQVRNNGTWQDVSGSDARFKARILTPGRYVFAVDKTNNKVRCYKSTDNETWTEQDSANAPAISSTANLKSIFTLTFDSFISVYVITSATRLDIFNYNVGTDVWGSSAFNATAAFNVSHVSGVAAMMAGFRSPDYPTGGIAALSDHVFANNGATETVMGNPRRRIKLSRRLISDGTWNTPYDVVGSGFTPDATLPGTAIDYDLRVVLMDGMGIFHVFWTQSDDSNIRQRSFNWLNGFGTAALLGSAPATVSNTALYPIGQPVNFFRGGQWRMAIPYVESGVLKLSKSLAGDPSAASWTAVTITTAAIEVTTSNPAVLIPDNENGGRLFAFFTKTDGKLYYTHDQGTDVWVAEQEFRPGTKTVAGLSAQALSDAIGLAYLDTSPTPDVIKYDQAEVFF